MPTSPTATIIHHLRRAVLSRHGTDMTDGGLLDSFIARRDEAAFEGLVRRHGPMVMGVCRRVARNVHDADDAFQATFLVLVRKAASIVPREMVGNWLYGVAYRTALDARAKRARRHGKETQVTDMPHPVVPPEEDWSDLQPLLDEELSRLPDKYRMPLVLCELEGRTRKDVARQLDVPEGTLSSRLATGRKLLAKRLAGRGLAITAGSLPLVLSQQAAAASVQASLITSTVKAAALVAAGETAAGVVSANVVALTEGALKVMLVTKLKLTAVVLMTVGALGLGSTELLRSALAAPTDQLSAAADEPKKPRENARPNAADKNAQAATPAPRGRASTVGGMLQGVDADKQTVTVSINNRQTGKADKTFELAKDAAIFRDGKPAKLADLKKGKRVDVKLSADQKTAVAISETGKTLMGQLKSVDPATNSITLTIAAGRPEPVKKEVTYELAKDGKVTLAGKEAKFADLKDVRQGSTVQLMFSVDDEKTLVSIQYAARGQ